MSCQTPGPGGVQAEKIGETALQRVVRFIMRRCGSTSKLILVLGLPVLIGIISAEPLSADEARGLVRSELTLDARTVAVAFASGLRADDPRYSEMLQSTDVDAQSPVRVAQLYTNTSLRVGILRLQPDFSGDRPYDLWLAPASRGWYLQVVEGPNAATSRPPEALGAVPLAEIPGSIESTTFVAALLPTSNDTGQLVLRWGGREWTTEIHLDNALPERLKRQTIDVGGDLTDDARVSRIARGQTLRERNESALVQEDGSRMSVLFGKYLGNTGPDFARIASTSDGAVIRLQAAAVTRLKTEVPLQFDDVLVDRGNLGAGFPGAYGLWLKRAGSEWRLVFNHEPDAWGTQHDPAFDAAEIVLSSSEREGLSRPFGVALVPTAADRGRVVIHWGPREWTADFVVLRNGSVLPQ